MEKANEERAPTSRPIVDTGGGRPAPQSALFENGQNSDRAEIEADRISDNEAEECSQNTKNDCAEPRTEV